VDYFSLSNIMKHNSPAFSKNILSWPFFYLDELDATDKLHDRVG
jgi:hypothetical protein